MFLQRDVLSYLFDWQNINFGIPAEIFDRVVKSAICQSGGKRWGKGLFILRTITIFGIFLRLWGRPFLTLVRKSSIGLWKLHFTCPKKVSRIFWKSFWLFRRLRILNENLIFFWILDEPFRQGCQTAFSSPVDYFAESVLILKNLHTVFVFRTSSGILSDFGKNLPLRC